jgi:hypothetical protein
VFQKLANKLCPIVTIVCNKKFASRKSGKTNTENFNFAMTDVIGL